MKYLFKVNGYFLFVVPVVHVFLYIVEHGAHLYIRSAVLRSFKRAERRGDCGIGVCSRGRYNVGCKGGVVTAAVLCVQHKRRVKHLCLKRGVFSVNSEHI